MDATSCFKEKGTSACLRILVNAIADRVEDDFVGWRLGGGSQSVKVKERCSFVVGVIANSFQY